MAERWNGMVSDLPFPTRRIALKLLYHLILSWMDGDRTQYHEDPENLESFLSIFSSDVCRWLVEYPNAEKYCPKLIEMGLNDPRLLDEALLPDK